MNLKETLNNINETRNTHKGTANRLLSIVFIVILTFSLITLLSIIGCPGNGKKSSAKNVLLITIDGMRGDMVGPKALKPMEMPALDNTWKRGTVFTKMITASPLRTASYASMFTGTYPPVHGVRENRTDKLPESLTTLAEILKKAEWKTGAISSNIDTTSQWGLDQGFDYYDDNMIPPSEDYALPHRTWIDAVDARDVTTTAVNWLEQASKSQNSWFLWVEYSDAAQPRNIPSPFFELFGRDFYLAALAYVDANMGVLLGKLQDLGMDKDTLVVITSTYGNTREDRDNAVKSVFTELPAILVPAVFVLPNKIPFDREKDIIVSSVDLMPTILGLTGLSSPRGIDGRDLSPALLDDSEVKPKTVYSENLTLYRQFGWNPVQSIINDNYHFVDIEPPELYDIRSDPKEEKNIAGEKTSLIQELKQEKQSLVSEMEKRKAPEIDEINAVYGKVGEKLKFLGYIPSSTQKPGEIKATREEIMLLISQNRKAIKARRKGDLKQAEEIYGEMLKKHPQFFPALYSLGELFAYKGSIEEAEVSFKGALVGGSRTIRAAALVGLAGIIAKKNKIVEAENLLSLALQLVPDNPAIYMNIGSAFLAQGLAMEAEANFRKSMELEPRFYKAHFGLANLYLADTQRIPAAVEELEMVLKTNPRFVPAHMMLAKIAAEFFKNEQKALFHLTKVREIVPPDSALAQEVNDLVEQLKNAREENDK